LITRTPAEDDERSIVVEMTSAGRAVLGQVMPGHVEVVQQLMLNALTRKDIAAMTDILGRVRDQMRAAPSRSAAPRSARQPPRRSE
jgi:DNA-binding MarR family transcriptional regulator